MLLGRVLLLHIKVKSHMHCQLLYDLSDFSSVSFVKDNLSVWLFKSSVFHFNVTV